MEGNIPRKKQNHYFIFLKDSEQHQREWGWGWGGLIISCKSIEWFSLDCRKTKTKVNTLANQRA